MSPRKTRRGAKAEGGDETLHDGDMSKLPDTPGDGNRTLRSRRQAKQKLLNESDVEQSPQLNESKRAMKKGRGKKAILETTADDSVVNVTISSNTTGVSSRKRTKKDQESTVIAEDSLIDQSQTNEPVSAKKTRGRKRAPTKKAQKDTDNTENLPNDQNIIQNDILNHVEANNVRYNNENVDGMTNEDIEVAAASSRAKKKSVVTPSNPRFLQLRSRGINSPGSIVTPESSPLIVNLTPHRTTKTPRKSPIDLGSPKTHSISPQRHSKTPRKLPIVAESPVPSDNSSSRGTPSTSVNTDENNSLKQSPSVQATNRRASKSPRATLHSPKSRSPRVTSKKIKKITRMSPRTSARSLRIRSPKISYTSEDQMINEGEIIAKSPQLVLQRVSPTKLSPKAVKTPPLTPSGLKRLSAGGESPKRPKSTGKKRSPVTSSGTPLRPILSPKRSGGKQSGNKSQILSSNSTPLTLLAAKNNKMTSSTPRERIRRSLNLSPTQSPEVSRSPLSVSTFYGKSPKASTKLENLSRVDIIDDETSPLITDDDDSFSMSGIKAVDETQEIVHSVVDDKEQPTIPEKEEGNSNDTYELAEPRTPALKKKKTGNDTYELDEPKTPGLKKKRNLTNTSLNTSVDIDKQGTKRVCKVRFASPPLHSSVSKITMRAPGHSRSATPASKTSLTRSPRSVVNRSRLNTKSPKLNETKLPRRRSNSMTSLRITSPSSSGIKKRSLSAVNTSSRSAQKVLQNESINRLSRPRHSIQSEKKSVETKIMSAKKAPNFAQIHQKKFAKMESLVDVKKRIEERHNLLTTSIATPSASKTEKSASQSTSTAKIAPRDATNGAFNRFGFKVRKDDAKKLINKQPSPKRLVQKKAEQRMALKGVRSNRRFELQMKMRRIDP